MKVKPKLYLNMSPQTAEDGSLAFARNMKIDDDGNLVSDYGYKNITCLVTNDSNPAVALNTYNIVGHVVGLDDKIYFFCATLNGTIWSNSKIIEYDEVENIATKLNTAWTYSGGKIDGYVSTNQSGEKILSIAEHTDTNSNIPFKHINLSYCSNNDNESIYTQAPKVPIANLNLTGTYVKTIPNGTYVFFIRYKIRKDVYTNWFLCSRPIFGGVSDSISTLQGGLKYINNHKDSAKSFVFNISFLIGENQSLYKEFQLGFIISHDDSTNARSWKSFTMPTAGNSLTIYFDYEDVKDVNIDNLLETTYELYNVKNVTNFKNKLYISNYIESNFNPDLATIASQISLSVAHSETAALDTRDMKYNGTSLHYDYSKGYYDGTGSSASADSIKNLLSKSHFTYDTSKLAKGNQKEKDRVASFKIKWLGSEDPDIGDIYSIENNLEGYAIFGSDSISTYEFHRGCTEISAGGNLWVYGPSSSPHPFYTKGLTFAYGSATEADMQGNSYCGNGSYFFNVFSRHSYRSGDPSNIGWTTRDRAFNDFARNGIDANIKKEIEGLSFFAKCYLEISSGGKVYKIGYDARMDEDNYVGRYNITVEPRTTSDYFLPVSEGFDTIGVERVTNPILSARDINSIISNNQNSLNNCNTEKNTYYLEDKIQDWVFNTITTYIIGFDEVGNPILDLSSIDNSASAIVASTISIIFKKFEFSVDSEDLQTDDGHYVKQYNISLKTTDYTAICNFSIKSSIISITDKGVVDGQGNPVSQASTLMPLSEYKAYAHFVDEHGIVTNGYPIKTINATDIGIAKTTGDIITLKYGIPNSVVTGVGDYKAFFISLANTGNLVVEGFNYIKHSNNSTHIINCLEVDALLYNINDNIKIEIYNSSGIKIKTVDNAIYYSSGSAYPPLAFGNCGYISWEEASADYSNCTFYIIIERNTQSENNLSLYKASAYIPITQTSDTAVPEGFYGAYFCLVKKPDFKLSSSCYVSGNDIYAINRNATLTLNDFTSFVQIQTSITRCVRSNFNLNYLSLTEDIADKIFTVGGASSGVKQVAKVINSAVLSYIYELKSMYKDFMNKSFKPVETDYKIKFDNTIRVSNVLSDETFNNSVFKFSAEDYYNVPTDRGVIVNLFAIGNNIFVHCKGSFYKFDGNTTIAANNQDIQLQESEPFETGITQLFDSEYGYGGIYNKEAGCITFDSYVFYDAMSNHIFAYGGNSQVQLIDASIYKLLCYYKPTYCRTLHDDANHRVLFEFTTDVTTGIYKTFTISYNYKSKSFVSFHDLSLENAFHSRYLSYSYKNDGSINKLIQLFDIKNTYTHQETIDGETVDVTTQIDITPLVPDMNIYKIYGNATTVCFIQFGADTQEVQSSPFNIAVVTFPQETYREVFNNLKYIGDIIKDNYDEKTNYEVIKFPQITRTNPVSKFYVITDRCVSTPVSGDVDDAQRPANPDDYKGFKYDMGSWNTNYFRNALNDNNIYQYPNQPGVNEPIEGGQTYTRHPNTDNNSLVYGKYFILVFDFIKNIPIKFEEVSINSNQY